MSLPRRLFLSHRVVLEDGVIDGGVLVDTEGVIERVVQRHEVDILLNDDEIQVVDGGRWALLAGVVDSHVHVNEPGRTAWEGFLTASAAAAAGGITTIVDMPLNSIPPTTTVHNLKVKAETAKGNVYTDVAFWGGVIPGNQDSLRDMVAAGVIGFKCFLCPSGVEEFPHVEASDLEKAVRALEGTGTVLAFHAEIEDENVVERESHNLKDPESYKTYLESRPPEMEHNAISLISNLSATTDVHLHVVHVSSAGVVPMLEEARASRSKRGHRGWRYGVTAETCHHYLSLSADLVPRGRTEYKCAPPIRHAENKEQLWSYVSEGRLDLIVSDHSPCTPDLKCSNTLEAWGGISSVQFGLSLFWSEASARGIGLETASRLLSMNTSRLCGLQRRKGALRPGLDADLVFFDPDAVFSVTPEIIRHKNKMPSLTHSVNSVCQSEPNNMQLECLELAGCTLDRYINADYSQPSFLEHGSDVAYFDGLGETIVSVGLVKPKPGVFQNFVKYLLVLTTTVDIVVLGVTFSSNKPESTSEYEEMHLVAEPVFMLPTDGVSMMVVKSTAKGRIFMGGKDGCLYEIAYQAQLGWFGKHCKKINHSTNALSFLVPSFLNAALYDEDPIVKIDVDNSRHILYTLSEKGCIEVFDLGDDGQSLSKVTKLTQGKIVSLACDIVKTLEASNFKPVVAISAVDSTESEYLNLVAVTQTGTRLYFSTFYEDANGLCESRPVYLNLIHVRLPPGFTPNASVLKPKQVHSAVYENGTLLMVCSAGGGEAEMLWCLSRVLPAPGFSEAQTLLPLDGPAWALTPLPSTHESFLSSSLLLKKEIWRVSRWLVVTSSGAAVIAAGAAPDLLRTLLRDYRGPESQSVRDFFQLHSVEQACACALYLTCEDTGADSAVSEWAARAFFLYGSQPTPAVSNFNLPSQMQSGVIGSPKFLPRQMSTPMSTRLPHPLQQNPKQGPLYPQLNQSFTGTPTHTVMGQSPYQQSITSPGLNQSSFTGNISQQRDMNYQPPVEYSAKHNALYIYVGRILSSIWYLKCVTEENSSDKKYMSSKITGEDCAYVVQKLQRVASFLQRVVSLPHSEEQASLHALKIFINMAIEMLNLWKVLCEHQFHVIAAGIPPEQQSALAAVSVKYRRVNIFLNNRELLVGGQEVACFLLGSLVTGYLRDNASVDGISQKLRQLCPTLYRQEDATCSKANELLLFAKQQKNPADREEMLQQALKLCKDVAPNVNMPIVCSKLLSCGFYSGVVELCVVCASRIDPQDKALHYYRSDQPSQDREGHLAYYRRMEIYREVCTALERLYEICASGSQGSDSAAQSTGDVTLNLSAADANYQGRKLVWECLYREDELLHVAIYEWLVSKGLGSELLSLGVAPPTSLRTYLQAAARNAPPSTALQLLDLLWKVLEKCGDHLAAANVLEGLATKPGSGATLAQRMSWLSAGVVCVRGAGAGGGELLRRLEEAAEVARVQQAVRAAAASLPRHLAPPPQHMQRLDDELLEITQLYEEYADRYNLWECKLAIVQCSGHNDTLLVENIWSNIINEAEAAARALPAADDRLAAVLSKITTLGREYVNTGHCFPLYFIVRQLEIMSCKLQADQRMVFKAILNIGVSIDQLLDIYIKLVSVNERVWLASGEETHAARVCALLLEEAREIVPTLPATARRRTLARAKDLHEAALCSLQARPNTQKLIDRLTAAQAHLDRMD
ncbi:Nuclear pore complex protein Nup154 [Eumeta japonica]|uniref:Nuclear pore complex protein Nup154 n=1 Tax=Eumeta variegata TaxID=151549 RepID=A0A4C1T9T8_EUMVA|nr:Nuclear pore complex protein Nup154 [Eumeta japonica]